MIDPQAIARGLVMDMVKRIGLVIIVIGLFIVAQYSCGLIAMRGCV